ncbi:MAG: type II toxin-antitoxin system VapC family toxin [Syntrophales bacterium]|jgi:predicted nucleic acid-binding protein|nr:type II toxin-antitoxin system VapC family toxin [Syntrophales bacterium]MCK9527705.1 type II toxin-antitoxin system VapC family toxin [Syntrophales bacterium]MDX9921640.1 type II toxin-antitoxin system VapC family toxin [Syntrophales bacterium]
MNIIDSSAWLAYFADEPNAGHFLAPLTDTASLVVPSITIYEVFNVILRESNENNALKAVMAMQKGTVVDLTASLAMAASKLSIEYNLPMADSIILATAQEFNAVIWTQDLDFKNISNVKFFSKKTGRADKKNSLP